MYIFHCAETKQEKIIMISSNHVSTGLLNIGTVILIWTVIILSDTVHITTFSYGYGCTYIIYTYI